MPIFCRIRDEMADLEQLFDENVDIKFSVRFQNNLHHVRSKAKNWKAKQLKGLGAIKPKGVNWIPIIV